MNTLPPTFRRWLALAALLGLGGVAQAQNVQFRETSDPAGAVDRTTFPLPGTLVSTLPAPDSIAGYRFTHWTFDGVRRSDPSGTAANPVVFIINGAVDAVAHYLPENQDADNDTLPDWWELRYLGTLVSGPTGDPDADGFSNTLEYFYGTSPAVADLREQGGLSRRRGDKLNIAVDVGDPSYLYGGVSRRRSALQLAILDPNYARLEEASSPGGVLAQTRAVLKGSTVNLSIAPEPAAGYHFTGWFVNGSRIDTPAQFQPIALTITADTLAVARYVDGALDSDGDGIPDWMEMFLFNTLAFDQTSDPDGDGLSFGVEQFRGYSQIAADTLAQGGVSRRRSATFVVDTTGRLPYTLASDPATILTGTQLLPAGTVIAVPDKGGENVAGYLFSWWDRNGVRQQDASGAAISAFTFTLNTATTVTGHYVNPTVDTDTDGIPDWYEWTFYGTLNRTATTDDDGDGFDFATELFRGQSPRVVDTLAQGGVSRRRTALTPVNAVFLPTPPAIGVNAATNITQTSARLSAVVNPVGAATTVYFQWGTTTAYGQQSAAQNLAGGLAAVTVNQDIAGLLADTLYHFRVVAANGQGTVIGEDATFRTLAYNYVSWAAGYGVAGRSADDDGDGLRNLLEFATGSNPTAKTKAPGNLAVGTGVLAFTYTRTHLAVADGVIFTVEWSDTLMPGSWSAAGVTQTVTADDGTIQQVTATLPAGPNGKRFVRLNVTQP